MTNAPRIRLALASVRLRHTHTQIQITPVLQANGLLKASPIFVRFKIAFISLRYILHNFCFIYCLILHLFEIQFPVVRFSGVVCMKYTI